MRNAECGMRNAECRIRNAECGMRNRIKKTTMGKENDNVIKRKSRDFAIDIINLYKWLCEIQHEYIMSKQLLRSGTSIGANVAEGVRGQTLPDFYAKMNIALKEANETSYWLDILHATDYLTENKFEPINSSCEEIIRILVAITKTKTNDSTLLCIASRHSAFRIHNSELV